MTLFVKTPPLQSVSKVYNLAYEPENIQNCSASGTHCRFLANLTDDGTTPLAWFGAGLGAVLVCCLDKNFRPLFNSPEGFLMFLSVFLGGFTVVICLSAETCSDESMKPGEMLLLGGPE